MLDITCCGGPGRDGLAAGEVRCHQRLATRRISFVTMLTRAKPESVPPCADITVLDQIDTCRPRPALTAAALVVTYCKSPCLAELSPPNKIDMLVWRDIVIGISVGTR